MGILGKTIIIFILSSLIFIGVIAVGATYVNAVFQKSLSTKQVLSDIRTVVEEIAYNFREQAKNRKNLFLRGNNPEDFVKYKQRLDDSSKTVQQLLENVLMNPAITPYQENLQKFKVQYEELLTNYNEALVIFKQDLDFYKADAHVRGIGKDAGNFLLDVSQDLQQNIENTYVASQTAINQRMLVLSALMALAVLLVNFASLMAIGQTLRRIVNFSGFLETTSSKNQFDQDYKVSKKYQQDEIGKMMQSFNRFRNIIFDHQANLEQKVAKRTETIEQQNLKLEEALQERKRAESQLIQSEKMAALGQLIAQIAHEVNTPAAAIQGAIQEIKQDYGIILVKMLNVVLNLDSEYRTDYLQLCTHIMRAPKKLISTVEQRKIAKQIRIGFEKNNIELPNRVFKDLALTNSELGQMPLFYKLYNLPESDKIHFSIHMLGMSFLHVRDIDIAISRITGLVKALKNYARVESTAIYPTQLSEDLDSTLIILNSKIKQGIQLTKEYDKVPKITAHGDQLNQVWTNIIHNAVQALGTGGKMYLRLKRHSETEVRVEIENNGSAIPADVLPRIFEPYFTTKKKGEGSGLGLSIVKGIIEKHSGSISVQSAEGCTLFTIILPIEQKHPTKPTIKTPGEPQAENSDSNPNTIDGNTNK